MCSRLSTREKLILLNPPNFQLRIFRIEWQLLSVSATRKYPSLAFSNPWQQVLRPACSLGMTVGTPEIKNWKVPRQSAFAKPSEINTYTKMGGGVPRCGSTEIRLTGISS